MDTSARNAGALTRRREIRDAATLLRLGLAYGSGGMLLREVTAWAQLHDVATLSDVSAEQVADCYRLRWQIELAFKRLKSLLHLDALRAKEPELAKAWIFANLLVAFLIDDIIQPSLDFPPEVLDPKRRTNSLWRITKMVI